MHICSCGGTKFFIIFPQGSLHSEYITICCMNKKCRKQERIIPYGKFIRIVNR